MKKKTIKKMIVFMTSLFLLAGNNMSVMAAESDNVLEYEQLSTEEVSTELLENSNNAESDLDALEEKNEQEIQTQTAEETAQEVPEAEQDVTVSEVYGSGRTVPYYSLIENGGHWDGTRYYRDNILMTDVFFYDGTYTYYLMSDGTPMRDRLTYHPDGEHIIYFNNDGHEVFTNFQYCPSVGYTCYFDSQGYIYKDQITFVGDKVYYLDANGQMQQNGWFHFANGQDLGYANPDGTLNTTGWGYDAYGRVVFFHWNGMVARGLISDGYWYYSMDTTDGHYLGQFINQYQYVAIGNSLTLHPIVPDLWWGSWGMAASTPDKDYFHRVCSYLEQTKGNTLGTPVYFKGWEEANAGRDGYLSMLDSYLSEQVKLVTIQLGDNITGGKETLYSDFYNLINYVKQKAPNAQIMVISSFCWPSEQISSAQRSASADLGVTYIDLGEISGNPAYRAGVGTVVYGDDGAWHTITNGAVGAHPNDAGFQYIADRIIEKIK